MRLRNLWNRYASLTVAFLAILPSTSVAQQIAIGAYSVARPNSYPGGITVGPDGALWFSQVFSIGRITTAGTMCPAGKPLDYIGQSRKRGNHYRQYHAHGADCRVCEFQAQCCPRAAWKGRTVSRLEWENEVVARFRSKMAREEAQNIYRQRGRVAEFPFAWIKEKFGLRKFRVFGILKARTEAVWACLAHNVMIWKRLVWAKALPQAA